MKCPNCGCKEMWKQNIWYCPECDSEYPLDDEVNYSEPASQEFDYTDNL